MASVENEEIILNSEIFINWLENACSVEDANTMANVSHPIGRFFHMFTDLLDEQTPDILKIARDTISHFTLIEIIKRALGTDQGFTAVNMIFIQVLLMACGLPEYSSRIIASELFWELLEIQLLTGFHGKAILYLQLLESLSMLAKDKQVDMFINSNAFAALVKHCTLDEDEKFKFGTVLIYLITNSKGKRKQKQVIEKLISIGVCAEKHFTRKFDHETDLSVYDLLVSIFDTRSFPQTRDPETSNARKYFKGNLVAKHGCFTCGKETKKLKYCSNCKSVYYCSRKCQRKDWKLGHKHRCTKFS